MPEVDVLHWNPERPVLGRVGRRLGLTRPVGNFGDLLGPIIVQAVLQRAGLSDARPARDAQLVTVGSILHLAAEGAVVWGSGRNGKVPDADHPWTHLDVRAVRGPRTRAFLQARGLEVPAVYGDPGLLTAQLMPELAPDDPRGGVAVVPNLNDLAAYRGVREVVDPRGPWRKVIQRIAGSELVVGSSLHGIVIAESFGVPARLVRSGSEDDFKYEDYYLGTGRPQPRFAESVAEAISLGGEAPPVWSPEPLLAAFPHDLWGATATSGGR